MSPSTRAGSDDGAVAVVADGPLPLARADDRQEQLLQAGGTAAYTAVVESATLSYGVQVPESAPYLERARAEGLAAVRRRTGGTGLVVGPGDIVWAVVVPRGHRLAGRDFVRAYDRFGAGVVAWFARAGIQARWTEPPDLSDDYCPLGGSGRVLDAGDRIVGAAAQHVTARAILHQGVLVRAVDRALVARCFGLAADGPLGRLGGWEELRGPVDPGAAATALGHHLAATLRPTARP